MYVTIVRGSGREEIIFGQLCRLPRLSGQKFLFLNGAKDILLEYAICLDGVAFSLPANQIEIVRTSKGRQVSKGKKVAATRVKFPGARIRHMTVALVILGTCVKRRVYTVECG